MALVLAAGLYFRDLLPLPEPTRYLGGDFASYFYPVFRYVAEEVQAGRLPHWTPYVGVGYPLLPDIEASVFYPPIRLLTFFLGPPSYVALEGYAIAHYVVAGIGMYALGRVIRLSVLGAAVAAVTFMCSGFLWAHSSHLTIVQSTAWLPWLTLAHTRALATGSAAWTVAAGALFALVLLGGHPQIAFYAAVAVALFAIATLEERWRTGTWRGRLAVPLITAAVGLLGFGLAAPQLLPTLSFAPWTSRWNPSPEFLADDALTVHELIMFLIPLAYYGTGRFRSMDEFYTYVGIGALVLAAAGIVLQRGLWARYFGLLTVVGLALALAPRLPEFTTVVRHLPFLGIFRAAARATLLTHYGLAGLAGMGLDAWGRAVATGPTRRLRLLAAGWRGAVALAVVGGVLVRLGRVPAWVDDLSGWFPQFYGYFLAILVAHVAVLELWRARWLPGSAAALVTTGLILVHTAFPHRAIAWSPTPAGLVWQSNELVARLRAEPGHDRIWNGGWLHRRGWGFEANAGLMHRLEIASHYTSLPPTRYNEFSVQVGDPWREVALVDLMNVRYLLLPEEDTSLRGQARYASPRLAPGDARLYEADALPDASIREVTVVAEPVAAVPGRGLGMAVSGGTDLEICLGCPPGPGQVVAAVSVEEHTVIASATLPSPQLVRRVHLRNRLPYAVTVRGLRLDGTDLYALESRYRQLTPNLWENEDALPRAFLVEEVVVQPDPARIIPTLLAANPRRTAVVEWPPRCRSELAPAEQLPPEAELLEYGPTLVRIRTRHARPAFLVLTDAYYKEWRATVDGWGTRIQPTDLLFRGVCVPAGHHEVVFRYRPFAFERGAVLAGVTALLAVGAVVIGRRRHR